MSLSKAAEALDKLLRRESTPTFNQPPTFPRSLQSANRAENPDSSTTSRDSTSAKESRIEAEENYSYFGKSGKRDSKSFSSLSDSTSTPESLFENLLALKNVTDLDKESPYLDTCQEGGDLSSLDPSKYKTELCRSHQVSGYCKYGSRCNYAHGIQQLRIAYRHGKYKTRNCRSYHDTGFCRYGARCSFIHDAEEGILKCPITDREVLETLHYRPMREIQDIATITWRILESGESPPTEIHLFTPRPDHVLADFSFERDSVQNLDFGSPKIGKDIEEVSPKVPEVKMENFIPETSTQNHCASSKNREQVDSSSSTIKGGCLLSKNVQGLGSEFTLNETSISSSSTENSLNTLDNTQMETSVPIFKEKPEKFLSEGNALSPEVKMDQEGVFACNPAPKMSFIKHQDLKLKEFIASDYSEQNSGNLETKDFPDKPASHSDVEVQSSSNSTSSSGSSNNLSRLNQTENSERELTRPSRTRSRTSKVGELVYQEHRTENSSVNRKDHRPSYFGKTINRKVSFSLYSEQDASNCSFSFRNFSLGDFLRCLKYRDRSELALKVPEKDADSPPPGRNDESSILSTDALQEELGQEDDETSKYKTELCRSYQYNKRCEYEESCMFAHGVEDLRAYPKHSLYRTKKCFSFHRKGFCLYGSRCQFLHDME